jgi:hypothetical protein
MMDLSNQALPEGQLRARSSLDRFARTAAILTGCVAFLAGLYFVFLYLLSSD